VDSAFSTTASKVGTPAATVDVIIRKNNGKAAKNSPVMDYYEKLGAAQPQ
jgi:hypothetical protein